MSLHDFRASKIFKEKSSDHFNPILDGRGGGANLQPQLVF